MSSCVGKQCTNHLIQNVKLYCTSSIDAKNSVSNNVRIDWNNAKPFTEIPGPKPIPILGNLWRFLPGGTYNNLGAHTLSVRLQEKYGNVVKLEGIKIQPNMVNIYEPKDIETICRTEGPWPKRDVLPSVKMYRDNRRDLFHGFGIFTTDGKEWHEGRSKLNPILMNTRTVKLYAEPIQEIVKDFVKTVKHLSTQNEKQEMPSDFNKIIQRFTLESVAVMALDMRLGLFNKDTENKEVVVFLNNVCLLMDYIYELDILPSAYKYIFTPTYKRYVKTMDEMVEFMQKHLKIALQKLETQEPKDNGEMTILEKLVKIDQKYLFGTICDMFFAGVDTTSRTVESWLYYVATNPEVQDRIRTEVEAALPTRDSPVSSEALENMSYTRASIKEVMRLSPISPGAWRKTTKNVVVSGYQLPKDTNVVLCFFANSRNPELFPEAEKFKPERWMREDGKRLVEMNPWMIQPFGFGPRSCIGKRLVMVELEQLLPKMVRNFKMEWHHPPATFVSKLMYGIADPLKIKMIPIDY